MTIKIEKQANDLDSGIQNMIDGMIKDYSNWTYSFNILNDKDHISGRAKKFIDKYSNNFKIQSGKKYIKIINENAVKAFIVKEDGYYKKGTILKAASWNLPAKHSRGNVLDGNYHIDWHGPLYLK